MVVFVTAPAFRLKDSEQAGIEEVLDGFVGYATQLFSSLIGAAYTIAFHWMWGQTLGKMALQIRVVSMDGGPLSFGQAVGRYFATFLSALILGIGFIMAGVRSDKRALHDLLAGTRVEYL